VREEIGDLLFAVANLARHVDVDAEDSLRGTNTKFEKRFAYIEKTLAERGIALKDSSLEQMDKLWNEAKTKA
jgi:ATP diphosphatase